MKLDISLARGLSYYTGAIFEIVLTNGDFAGSIGGGGRYDGLIGMFGKEQIPACGFSLGLERILVVMEERGMFQKLVAKENCNWRFGGRDDYEFRRRFNWRMFQTRGANCERISLANSRFPGS